MSDASGVEAKRITRNAGVLAAMTMVSRLAGLVRDFCITHFFGASGLTDVFYMAFTIPNVMRRLVAEGTLTVTFMPTYVRVREQHGDGAARALLAATFGFILVVVSCLALVGVLAAPALVLAFASGFLDDPEKFALTVELTRWLFPVILLISLVALSMAVLNAHDLYGAPALAPIAMNVGMIVMTVVGARAFERPIFGVVVGVLVGGALQVLVQLPSLVRFGLLVRPTMAWGESNVREMLMGMIPGIFTLAVYQINVIVLRQIASYMSEGSVSYYYTSDRLLELTNGVFAIAIAQGSFTAMSRRASAGDLDGLKAVWRFSFKLQNLIAIPAAIGLAVLARPIVAVLFLHGQFDWTDVELTSACVVWASGGLIATATIRGTAQVFYALNDRITPAVVSAFVVGSNLCFGLLAMRLGLGIAGLSGALAISNVLQAAALIVLLRRKLGPLGLPTIFGAALAKTGAAAAAGAAAWGLSLFGKWGQGPTAWNFLWLGAAIGVAVLVYTAVAVAAGFEGADAVRGRLTARLRRRAQP